MAKTSRSREALILGCILIAGLSSKVYAGDVLRFVQGEVQTADPKKTGRLLAEAGAMTPEDNRTFVVQFKTTIQKEDRKNIETLGGRILRYIPDDAYIVEGSSKVIETIARGSQNVRLIVPFQPKWKVAPQFQPASILNAQETGSVTIRILPVAQPQVVASAIAAVPGVKVLASQARTMIVEATRAQVEDLARVDGVEWIQPTVQVDTFDFRPEAGPLDAQATPASKGDYTDIVGYETGTKVMRLDSAWARGYSGAGQIVAMADTGLDTGDINNLHPDLKGRVVAGMAFGMFAQGDWSDPMGHGTHVAGSVASNGAASGGRLRGSAYNAGFIAEGMWSPMLKNLSVPPKLKDMFEQAYQRGARIHTNSWGASSGFGVYDGMAQQVDEYMFSHPDFLLIFAAGNSGVDMNKDGRIDANSIGTPGTAKNVLTVGASENFTQTGGILRKIGDLKPAKDEWPVDPINSDFMSNNPNGLAMFSSRGPTLDGRTKPDVVAPGTNILSMRSHNPQAEPLWGEYNKDYVWCGGTSMATPLTAGAAAVAREYLVRKWNLANPSAALLKAVLMHSADDMYPGQFGAIGAARGQELITMRPNSDEGFGRVNMDRATSLDTAMMQDEKNGLGTNEQHTYPIKVNANGKISVTLAYTDAPAAPSAAKALVNDLDIVLVAPNGQQYGPNDHINNVELIEMAVPAGSYQVLVKGVNVPQGLNGRQPYALIVTLQ